MSTTWKKAFSTLATASLLASLFATAVAAPVAAANTTLYLGAVADTALADGVDSVVVASSTGDGVPVGTTLRISITDGTIPSFVGSGMSRVDASTIEYFNSGTVSAWGGSAQLFTVASTKAGVRTISIQKKGFNGSFSDNPTTYRDVTFIATNATDLVTPAMAITAGQCTGGNKSNPVDITTASSANGTPFYGTAVACAWVLLAENEGGAVALDVTAGLSAWTFSIAPYGLLHTALGAPVTSGSKLADATANVTIGTDTYLAAGVTIYANGSVGKTTVSWTGTYRGKAYTASDSLTFTGPAVAATLSGGGVSKAISATPYAVLTWISKDTNGITVSGSSGDMTGGSSNDKVATVAIVDNTTASFTCLTAGTTVVTVKTKTGITPAFTSNGVTVTCGAGAASAIVVTATATKVGGISTITATVTDAKGLRVVDNSPVVFAANGGIFIDPDDFSFEDPPYTASTKNGVATISLWAPSVPSVITVLAQNGGKTGIGTVNVTAAAPSTASGITARVGTGSYASTTRVARLGQTITWRANLGSAAAGAKVGVYQRTRNANGTWSTIRRWATATANSSGVVTFSYKYTASKWIQIRFVGEAGSTSFLGGVWR